MFFDFLQPATKKSFSSDYPFQDYKCNPNLYLEFVCEQKINGKKMGKKSCKYFNYCKPITRKMYLKEREKSQIESKKFLKSQKRAKRTRRKR